MNQNQLKMLKNGVLKWNAWRKNHPNVEIDLTGIDLYDHFSKSDEIWNHEKQCIDLTGIDFSFVDISHSNLEGVRFVNADLSYCNLSGTNLWDCFFLNSNLTQTNFTKADLTDIEITNCIIYGLVYDKENLIDKCNGAKISGCKGDDTFAQDVLYRSYIDTVKKKIPAIIFWIWGYFTNYGQSLTRTLFSAMCLILVFATVYYGDYFYFHKLLHFKDGKSFLTPLYFSVATFSNFGFGDVYPVSWVGELLVIIEITLGYVTLGLMLAVLSNNFSRK